MTVLGAAAMVSGGVAWSLKESSREQLLDDCGGGDECHGLTSAEFRDRRSRVETRTTVSNVLLFGGGALLAGGLTLGVLHFAADRDDPTASGLSAGLSLDAGWVTYDAAF